MPISKKMPRLIRRISAALAVSILLVSSSGCMASRPTIPRPERWAASIAVEGAPNLYRVTDSLYRSAQPTRLGFKNLAKMGVRTVVNLRGGHSDTELIEGTGLALVEIPIPDIRPKDRQVVKLLKILADESRCPVLVHCKYGADRTGAMIAACRVAVEGWSNEDALSEMTGGGFGFHVIWTNLESFVKNLDAPKIRLESGIKGDLSINGSPFFMVRAFSSTTQWNNGGRAAWGWEAPKQDRSSERPSP